MAVTLSCHSPCVGDQPMRRLHFGVGEVHDRRRQVARGIDRSWCCRRATFERPEAPIHSSFGERKRLSTFSMVAGGRADQPAFLRERGEPAALAQEQDVGGRVLSLLVDRGEDARRGVVADLEVDARFGGEAIEEGVHEPLGAARCRRSNVCFGCRRRRRSPGKTAIPREAQQQAAGWRCGVHASWVTAYASFAACRGREPERRLGVSGRSGLGSGHVWCRWASIACRTGQGRVAGRGALLRARARDGPRACGGVPMVRTVPAVGRCSGAHAVRTSAGAGAQEHSRKGRSRHVEAVHREAVALARGNRRAARARERASRATAAKRCAGEDGVVVARAVGVHALEARPGRAHFLSGETATPYQESFGPPRSDMMIARSRRRWYPPRRPCRASSTMPLTLTGSRLPLPTARMRPSGRMVTLRARSSSLAMSTRVTPLVPSAVS